MERLPTWNVWYLLHSHQNPERDDLWARVLHTQPLTGLLKVVHNLWLWIAVSLGISLATNFSISQFPWIIQNYWFLDVVSWTLLILINLICFRFVLHIINVMSEQKALGHYDLIFVVPRNEYAVVLDIMRAVRYPFDGMIGGKRSGVVLSIILSVLTLVVIFNLNFAFPNNLIQSGTALIGGVYEFIQYLQIFVSAILVTLLASQLPRSSPQIIVVGVFIILQMIFFVLINRFFGVTAFDFISSFSGSDRSRDYIYLWWSTLFHPLIIIGCRELINFVLWQAVKRRLEA